jgi:hypothetical protein
MMHPHQLLSHTQQLMKENQIHAPKSASGLASDFGIFCNSMDPSTLILYIAI